MLDDPPLTPLNAVMTPPHAKDPKNAQENRLALERSPYLKQHARNPVDWFPWGTEALQRARREQKPIFLSIGYSACHWCHVMERESFEDPAIAALLKESFISIKVDREERPDLDNLYMTAVQLMTQHGGWPMSVFLTPDLVPFYGGTYFPPEPRHGMPSFTQVLQHVSVAWKNHRSEILASAGQMLSVLKDLNSTSQKDESADGLSNKQLLSTMFSALDGILDRKHGGMGNAPKFFHSMGLRFLLWQAVTTGNKEMVQTLTSNVGKILAGGIQDHVAGGFHRYSTDSEWHVPHFEKMLYDQSLLIELCCEMTLATQQSSFAEAARLAADFVLDEMTGPEGGFYSALDADSDAEEGKYYVWKDAEVRKLLGPDIFQRFCEIYDVTPEGNWEGNNILRLSRFGLENFANLEDQTARDLAKARRLLRETRNKRTRPSVDTKVILAWNAMMVHSLCTTYQVLGDSKYLAAAERAARFILSRFQSPARFENGAAILFRCYAEGRAYVTACLDDYAQWIHCLVSLYESDLRSEWLSHAEAFAESAVSEFWSAEKKVFYFTGNHHEQLPVRSIETQDGAIPSSGALLVTALQRLFALTGNKKWGTVAEVALGAQRETIQKYPTGHTQWGLNLWKQESGVHSYVIALGSDEEENKAVMSAVRRHFDPSKVIAIADPKSPWKPLADKPSIENRATVYRCQNFTCLEPLVGEEALLKSLRSKTK